MAIFDFDPTDLEGMCRLMKQYHNEPLPFFGVNEHGERVLISVNEHNITVETFQHNNWLRTNVYYDDGIVEELYDRAFPN